MQEKNIALSTEHALAFALDLRRLRNGRLDAQTLRQNIEGENITVLGDTLVNDVPRIIKHSIKSGRMPPVAIRTDQSDVILELIQSYENSRRQIDNLTDEFPIAPGERGMLSVVVLSIEERNKAGDSIFANGNTWQTTSHITMKAVPYGADHDKGALAIWHATTGRRALYPFYQSLDSRKPIVVMATAREEDSYIDFRGIRRTSNKIHVRASNTLATKITRVRLASQKQIDAANKKAAKNKR